MIGEILGLIFIGIGVFFAAVGVIGMMRMPDVYTRLHSSGKVTVLGVFGLLIGTAFLQPEATLKLFGLGLFLLLSAPIATHAIAASAYRSGVPMKRFSRDDLVSRMPAPAPEE